METFCLELLRAWRADGTDCTLYTSYAGGVRAAIVSDPGEYHWSGWTAALNGDEWARRFYMAIYRTERWAEARELHVEAMRDRVGYFRQASRAFLEGGASGDENFVAGFIKDNLPPGHKGGPKSLPGGKRAWGELRVAREKRQRT